VTHGGLQDLPDPLLTGKIRDVAGLYLAPPANAAVFAVDEKPQIQAYPGRDRRLRRTVTVPFCLVLGSSRTGYLRRVRDRASRPPWMDDASTLSLPGHERTSTRP
jgi:hypothetical protein